MNSSFWSKKKVFITGHTGFKGSWLCLWLQQLGAEVTGYALPPPTQPSLFKVVQVHQGMKSIIGDIRDSEMLTNVIQQSEPDIVIHLAAQAGVRYSIEKPRVYLDSNIIGSYNIIEVSKKFNVKHLIMASSSSVYGANKRIPFKETDKTETQLSIYAATKKSNESMAHSYSNIWKVPITMLRFFTVYGPWGRPDMALFKFTKGILNNKKIDIYNYGKMYRDFTYIDDIVNGIALLINKAPNINQKNKYKDDSLSSVAPFRILNIGNTKKIFLLDFIKQIEHELGKKAIRNYMPLQKGDVKQTLSNTSLLKKITGYNPKTNYKNGIKKFINWYKKYYYNKT